MSLFTVWINAFRLRTLPLAAASIIVAGGLAVQYQVFNLSIFFLSLSTALLLQILSNLANDYGDAVTGVDSLNRVGPKRAMQSGLISMNAMKMAIITVTSLCLISGLSLLALSFSNDVNSWLLFLGLGLAAIVAAITYTMGKFPYGYRAMGDLAVFFFFGLLGVLGGFYLQALTLPVSLLLPALSIGFLSVAVLNVNNMRDVYSDTAANKITLVVLLGRKKAFIYHLLLIISAMLCSAVYLNMQEGSSAWQYLFLLTTIPLSKSCLKISDAIHIDSREGQLFNDELKNTAMSTFVFSLLFAIVLIV